MPTNTGIVPITPSSLPTSQAANWSVDSSNNPVWVVTLDNGSVEYYDYPGGSIITPTLPLLPLTETDFEIVSKYICVNNQNWVLSQIYDNSTGTPQNTGIEFFEDNSGTVVPSPANYTIGVCEVLFTDLQVGGQLIVTDSAVVTLASVVNNLTINNVIGIPTNATGVFIQAKMYDINDVEDIEGVLYYTRNGNDPTNNGQVGYVLYQGGTINIGRESIDDNASNIDLQNLKFIAKQGYKVLLEVTYIGIQ